MRRLIVTSHDNCNCGEEHDHDFETIVVNFDGEETECIVLGVFPASDNEYIALLPMRGNEDDGEPDPILLKYIQNDDSEEFELLEIENDDEYEAAVEVFCELFLPTEDDDASEIQDDI